MFLDWLLASFHHLAVFSLAAILSAEIFLTGGTIDDRMALRLARVDAWFGIMAAIALAAGLLRVFLGAKGADYYLGNTFFWLKMALFAAVGLISIAPTFSYLVWRRRLAPTARSARRRARSPGCAWRSTPRRDCSRSSRSAPPRWPAGMECEARSWIVSASAGVVTIFQKSLPEKWNSW